MTRSGSAFFANDDESCQSSSRRVAPPQERSANRSDQPAHGSRVKANWIGPENGSNFANTPPEATTEAGETLLCSVQAMSLGLTCVIDQGHRRVPPDGPNRHAEGHVRRRVAPDDDLRGRSAASLKHVASRVDAPARGLTASSPRSRCVGPCRQYAKPQCR